MATKQARTARAVPANLGQLHSTLQERHEARYAIIEAQNKLRDVEAAIMEHLIQQRAFSYFQVNWRKLERDTR